MLIFVCNPAKKPVIKKPVSKKQCSLCGKMVVNLAIHLKIHSGVKSYLCEMCGRTFALKSYLRSHKQLHHPEKEHSKPFSCCLCAYTAHSKNQLVVHERTHTGERVSNKKHITFFFFFV